MNNELKNQTQPNKSNDRSQADQKVDQAGKKSQDRDESRSTTTERNQEKR
jgi:hypothetical protein